MVILFLVRSALRFYTFFSLTNSRLSCLAIPCSLRTIAPLVQYLYYSIFNTIRAAKLRKKCDMNKYLNEKNETIFGGGYNLLIINIL